MLEQHFSLRKNEGQLQFFFKVDVEEVVLLEVCGKMHYSCSILRLSKNFPVKNGPNHHLHRKTHPTKNIQEGITSFI